MSSESEDEFETCYFWREDEGDIELPSNNGDGDCIVHYMGSYSDYVMKATMVNGKREGKATIWHGEKPIVKLEYKNGEEDGIVEMMNEAGEVELRGQMEDGFEKGVFKEYYDSMVVWVGYYRDGRRYSVLRESVHMNGYYEERRVHSGKLLSIAQYDSELKDKNGHCIIYEGGRMKEWMYENGVKKEVVIDENENGRKRNKQDEERNENENKRTRVSLMHLLGNDWDQDKSLIMNDLTRNYKYGIVRRNDAFWEVKQSWYENRLVCVDMSNQEMRVYKNDELVIRSAEAGVIDLDVNGKRWEGGLRDGTAFGYGTLYSEEGRRVYEGFMMGERKICYGIEFYDDIERVKYDGCYFDDKRCGYGVLYDRNGDVEYDGLWKNDARYSSTSDGFVIDTHTDSLAIPDYSYLNAISFEHPSLIPSLKRLVTGSLCFSSVYSFILDGMNELESIVIGECSFELGDGEQSPSSKGFFQLKNCPKLKSIKAKNSTFQYCHSCNLENLPSLQSIDIGPDCFWYARSFELISSLSLIHY